MIYGAEQDIPLVDSVRPGRKSIYNQQALIINLSSHALCRRAYTKRQAANTALECASYNDARALENV